MLFKNNKKNIEIEMKMITLVSVNGKVMVLRDIRYEVDDVNGNFTNLKDSRNKQHN